MSSLTNSIDPKLDTIYSPANLINHFIPSPIVIPCNRCLLNRRTIRTVCSGIKGGSRNEKIGSISVAISSRIITKNTGIASRRRRSDVQLKRSCSHHRLGGAVNFSCTRARRLDSNFPVNEAIMTTDGFENISVIAEHYWVIEPVAEATYMTGIHML